MNVFNMINGGGGSGSGLYVWKKYEYIPEQTIVNPTFHIKANVSTQKAIITSNDINFKAFGTLTDSNNFYQSREPKFCNFMNGFKNSNSSVNFAISASTYSGQLELNYLNNSYWNAFTKMTPTDTGAELTASNLFKTTIDDTLQYTGTKTIAAKIGEFISYVVSEDSTTYPDGGEQGGYYYESFTPYGIDAFGCTKYETGSFTVTSTTTSWKITHSLGVVPKFVILYRADTGTQYLSHAVYTFTTAGTYGGGGCASMSTSTNPNYENLSNASSTYVQLSTTNLSSFYFYGTLKYIILA